MNQALEKVLNSKQNAIKTLSLNGTELNISKSVEVSGDVSCEKLICNSIEVRNTGSKTLINDAIITKSTIDSTPIGIKLPSLANFTQLNIISSFSGNKLNAFKIDGDINIFNSDQATRNINCSSNPLSINTNEHLILNSQNKINLITNKTNLITNLFNINTPQTTHSGIFHILNNSNSTSLSTGSLIIDGGMAISKNITLGGTINSLIDNTNNIKGQLNVQNNISTSGILIINNQNNSNALIVNGGVIIKKNTNISDSLTVFNNLNILNNNNSTNFIQGNTIINNNLTIAKNINCGQNLNINGSLTITESTDSNNIDSGSLIIKGGIGITKNINIGGTTKINGNLTIFNQSDSYNINTGSFITHGGAYINKSIYINNNSNINGNANINGKALIKGNLTILNTEESNNINTGSIKTLGGLSVTKNINTNGIVTIHNDTQSTNISNGSLIIEGGVGIGKNLNVGQNATINNNLTVSNELNGNNIYLSNDIHLDNIYIRGSILKESGGELTLNVVPGQFSDLIVRDDFILTGEDESFDITTGSFITDGGVGIKKSLNVGKDLNVLGNATFNNNVNCVKTLYAENIHVKYNITSSEGEISGSGGTAGLVGQPDIPFDTLVGNLNISNNISVSNAFSFIDQWVNRHLIDTPPTLINTNAPIENSEFIQLEFNLPTQIFVGFLNKKLPIIDDLFIDFKKSDETDYTTINIGSILINKIIIYPFNYTNYIENQTFYLFNILKETEYDFRVYVKNNNTIRPTNYLQFNNLKTKAPNLLPPPTNISINKNLNNSSTSMDLNWTHSISPNIPIYQYNISYSTLDSIKYPSFIHHNSNKFITSSNIIYNANNFTTINNLYAGHTYNINIQAKNILHSDFGEFSNLENTFTLDPPNPPSYISNNNLYILNNSNYYFNINNGYSLDGNTYINNIYNYNKLDDHLVSNILENIRINEIVSTTDLDTTKIISNLNNSSNSLNIYCNLNLNGFSHTSNSTDFENKFNLKLSNVRDFYDDDEFNNGFYKTTDLQITFNNSTDYLLPSSDTYTLQIQQNLPFSNIDYKSDLLYLNIDQIESTPEVYDLIINSVDSTIDYSTHISGVPTIIDGNINFDFKTKYLTNNYLRNDKKHFNINLITNNINFSPNINIYSDDFKNTNKNYYNINESIHNDGNIILHNTQDLLFKDESIKINNINYTEDLNININAFNLHGNSFNTFSTKIRLDNESLEVINNIGNANSSLGLYVTSGDTQYPDSNYGNTFNHQVDLVNTFDLQLVNGYFSTPYNINTFLNYTNYFNHSSLIYPDYSSILTDASYRYITFKYNIVVNDINKITIEFMDSNINELLTSNYQLFIKIVNISNPNFNTAWLDANKVIDVIGLNNNSKNINGTGCLSMFSNYLSTSKKKYCYLPNGSVGILYVKLGFKNNIDFLIKYIKVQPDFI